MDTNKNNNSMHEYSGDKEDARESTAQVEPKDTAVELATCRLQLEEYLNGWKRAQADLTNLKKDEARKMQEFAQFANESLLLEVIEALDALYLAIQHAPPDVRETQKAWFDGLLQTQKQFESLLRQHNIQRIAAEGVAFDPVFHEVVSSQEGSVDESRAEASQQKVHEIRPGYILHNKVIRPSRVILS